MLSRKLIGLMILKKCVVLKISEVRMLKVVKIVISEVSSSVSMIVCLMLVCVVKLGWICRKVNVLFVKLSSSVSMMLIVL